ncbi:S-layer homology domain-containing protein [Lysinibacillus sphaericus]|uniref:S-layer homology domain-containing protein n=1 Tax=Lysinibacillus sphaericus TaxID=1421 RepID=UPI000C1A6E53|nr:S-layer homology domain-containing protein [Lysinibacillus sphaericus]PIJ96671.1 S-layer protein [Lysinibacillus sphaericus]
MAKQNKGRKFFAASATAALVASAIVPVASAAQLNDFNKISGYAKEAVQSLVDAGVIQGDANGNFNPLKTISRAEAATIFTNALELEAEGDVNFKDVKADAWYYDAIAATVENGIFEGVSATEFAPNKQLTRSEAAKILVDAFELEGEGDLSEFADASTVKPWAKSYLEIAVANGVIKGSEANGKTNLNPNAPITRQDFAVVFSRTIENVDATPKVDKIEVVDAKTLNVTLSDGTKETVTLEKALEPNKETEVTFKIKDVEYKAKVTYVVTTATAVKSVSATNLKEVVVEFDGTVDKETAEEASNYTLKSGKAVKSVKLSDDKKTATVTVVGTLTNNKADAISISNVKAGDKVINVKNVEFTAVDNKLPEVTAVKSLGTKSVKLEFSEPVKGLQQSNFTLDGKAYFGKITMGANDRSVILTPFSSTALSVGDHKLTVTGVKDYADFVSLSSTHDFKVVEDKEAPTVTEATATLESVTLTFSEDVDVETIKASNVYWKSGDSKKEAHEFEAIADNKYKFFFKEDKTLPTGKVDIHVEGVKDFSDNQIAKDTKVTVTPEIDQTRPEVKKVTVTDARVIKVTFSKALDSKSVQEVKNYTVLNKDGKVVSVQNANLDPNDSKTVIINLYSDLSTGENKLTIKNIKDATKLQNTMLDYSDKIVRGDKDAPEFDSKVVNTKERRVVLTFNKKMNVDTLVDYSNYLVKIDGKLQTLSSDLADISVMQDGTTVVITFAETIDGKTVDFVNAGSGKANVSELQVLGVKDVAGNLLKEFADTTTGTGKNIIKLDKSTDLALADINNKDYPGMKAELVDKNTIKVKLNAGVKSASTGAFSYEIAGVEQVKDVEIDGTSTVKVKFKDGVLGTSAADLNLKVDFTKLVTLAGNTPEGSEFIKGSTNLLDSVKPEITDKGVYAVNGNKISITYSEAIKFDADTTTHQDLIDADFIVTRVSDNKELNPIGDYNVSIEDGNKLVITLSDARKVDTSYKVSVKESAKYVIDYSVAKNTLTKSTGESAKVTATANVTGTLTHTTPGVAPNAGTPAVPGVDTVTFTDAFLANEKVTIGGVELTLVANGTAAETATAVKGLVDADTTLSAKYTVANPSAGVLTFTQKAGQESATALTAVTTSVDGKVASTQTTPGVAAVAPTPGTAQVETLTVNGTAVGSANITVTLTIDGTAVAKTVAVAAGDTAAQVAAKIKDAFTTGLTGWTVSNASNSADVVFTADAALANKTVTATIAN